VLTSALCASAQAGVYTFTDDVNEEIPDNSIIGLTEAITISGLSSTIEDVEVTLDIIGGFNGDLYGYLRLNGSPLVVLVNCVGVTASDPDGYANSGMLVTLTSSPTAPDIHFYQNFNPTYNSSGQLTGTWQADGRTNPLDTSRGSLSEFDGLNPNGTWTLFFADTSAGFPSTLVSWSLTITTVPEPVNVALLCFGALAALLKLLSWRRSAPRTSPAP
jgi:subtilisin-like proprotein convertase family protein